MADTNIKITHEMKTTAAGRPTQARQSGADAASMRKLTDELGKLFKEYARNTSKSLETSFEKIIMKYARKVGGPAQAGGAPSGGGLSAQDAKIFAKTLADAAGKELINKIYKTYTGTKAAPKFDDKILDSFLRKIDKQANVTISNMNSLFARKGIHIDPKDIESLRRSLSSAMRQAVPRESGAALKEISQTSNSLKRAVVEIGRAANALKNVHQSGRKIDVTEINKALSSIKKVGQEYENVKVSSVRLGKALGSVTDDIKKFKDELISIRRSVGAQVRGVRQRASEDPGKFAKLVASELGKTIGDIYKKSPEVKDTKIAKIFDSGVKNIGDVVKKVEIVQKDLLTQVAKGNISTSDLKKGISDLNRTIGNLPKQIASDTGTKEWKELTRALDNFSGKAGAIMKKLELTVDPTTIKKQIEKLAKEKLNLKLDIKESDIKRVTDAVSKKVESGVSKAVQKGIESGAAGALSVPKGKAVVAVPAVSKDIAKVKSEVDKTFKDLVTGIKNVRIDVPVQKPEIVGMAKRLEKSYDVSSIEALDKTMNQVTREMQEWNLPDLVKNLEAFKGAAVELQVSMQQSGKTHVESSKVSEELRKKEKELIDATEEVTKARKEEAKEIKKGVSEAKKKPEVLYRNKEAESKRLRPAKISESYFMERPFKEGVIIPGVTTKIKGAGVGFGGDVRKEVEKYSNDLSTSLKSLQDEIIQVLTDGFEQADQGWQVLDKQFQLVGNEWKLKIANITGKKGIGSLLIKKGIQFDPQESIDAVLDRLESVMSQDIAREIKVPRERAQKIGEWLKTRKKSEASLVKMFGERVGSSLADISKEHTGVLPSVEMLKDLTDELGKDLDEVFKKTFVKEEVGRRLSQRALVKEITLPAARLSKRGTATFRTAHGSERALPKFATYKTGFENLCERMQLEGKELADVREKFAGRIRSIGIRPTGTALVGKGGAKELAKEMLGKLIELDESAREFVIEQYKQAATMVGVQRQRAGISDITSYEQKFQDTLKKLTKAPASEKTFEKFSKTMEEIGISAYDVVKSMESIEVENIYDIYKKTLKGKDYKKTIDLVTRRQNVPAQLESPLARLAAKPEWGKSIRDFESAVGELKQLMPLIEPGRPRRGKHQEDVLITMFQKSDVYKGATEEFEFDPQMKKQKIQDINLNLREMLLEYNDLIKSAATLTEQAKKRLQKYTEEPIPTEGVPGGLRGIKRISSLGIPEEQASKYEEFRPYKTGPGTKSLGVLEATAIKTYTENLLDMAPFGEFNRLGRTVHNVNAAMSSMTGKLKKEGIQRGAALTEVPSFRTAREKAVLESGRYGTGGYGFNVVAELRHTAGTFEDQIIVSNKLVDAMTQAVKVLVKPSQRGRLTLQPTKAAAGGITDIEKKTLKDVALPVEKKIEEVSKEFMKIFGMPEKYRGRADIALIEEVKKNITTLQGEPVEVQEAKLVEIFMNQFARKFATRYGTKGVSITAAGEEGLGEVVRPKTMGKLGQELLDRLAGTVEGINIKDLQSELVKSGNKFIIDMFSVPTNVIAREMMDPMEVEEQAKIFNDFTKIMKKVYHVDIKRDLEGISQLKEVYRKQLSKKEEDLFEKIPIDIRISSRGIAKRGLQPEFMEAIMGNVIGITQEAIKKKATTTIQPKIGKGVYEQLLGTPGKKGLLSVYSEALGYKGAGTDVKAIQKKLMAEGMEEAQAKRAAALEAASNYYSTVENEFGKAQALVGPKFVQIIEEPHEFEEWMPKQIKELKKGGKLNLPAYAAYSAIFGEKSPLMKEIAGTRTFESKKHLEFIKALEMGDVSPIGKVKAAPIMSKLETVMLDELEKFTERSGRFVEKGAERSLTGTILDLEKYPAPFKVNIPTGRGARPGEIKREPFYIPGALARQTYPEPLVAGEFGMETVVRRLQHVINMAKEAEDALTGKALTKQQIQKYLPGKIVKRVSGYQTAPLERKMEIFEQLRGGLTDLPVEKVFQREKEKQFYAAAPQAYQPGISEKEYIDEFLRRKIGAAEKGFVTPKGETLTQEHAYNLAIGRALDILVGPSRAGAQEVRPDLMKVTSRITKALESEGTESINKLMDRIDITVTSDEMIDNALNNLERAKIAYMEELARTILGKKGSVAQLAFERKTPAYMAKAVAGVVDRTKELQKFRDKLKEFSKQAGFEEFSDEFKKVAENIADINKEHKNIIEKYKKMEIPVLKQTEIGIPEKIAKKIPVSFEKRYKMVKGKGLFPLERPKKMEYSNLAEMLGYRGMLERGMKKTPKEYQAEIRKHIQEELQPYIESVRYPFTGISSVQPYKAKILPSTGKDRDIQKYALQVPGIPEMKFAGKGGFQEQMDILKGVKETLVARREKLQMEGVVDPTKIKKLSELIESLNKAIADVLPKYTAVQQKLDFDGDQIQIHSAILKEARSDIEKHFKSVTGYKPGTAGAWREKWTYEEMTPTTSKTYPLADILKVYEKKWAPEKGYELLSKPEVTELMDFLKPPEVLKIMAELSPETARKRVPETGEIQPKFLAKILKGVVEERIREPQYLSQVKEAVDKAAVEEGASSESIVASVDKLGDEVSKLVSAALKAQLTDKKYSDAIVAQLYKLHTGVETEAIYRVHRVAERRIGFGEGMIGAGGYRTPETSAFRQRWPKELSIFGGIAPEEEIHTFMNELERFAIQKGMDVKLAGEEPVAGAIASYLSQGVEGVEKLLSEIGIVAGAANEDYKQLLDFSKTSEQEIKERLGKVPTEEIAKEVGAIREARGLKPVKMPGRKEAIEQAVKLVGFEGFLYELARQIEEDAVEAWISRIQAMPKEAQVKQRFIAGKTDPRMWAIQRVEAERKGEIAGLKHINVAAVQREAMPLYTYRGFQATPRSIAEMYKRTKAPPIEVPEKIEKAGLKERYENIQAVIDSLSRSFREIGERAGAGGVYNQMVASTLENIHEDQAKIQEYLKGIKEEGYIGERPALETIPVRLETGDFPTLIKDIITRKPDESLIEFSKRMEKSVDKISMIAGVPVLREDIKKGMKFGDIGEKLDILAEKELNAYITEKNISIKDEKERKSRLEKHINIMNEKAYAVAQLDKAIAAMQRKESEGKFFEKILPDPSVIKDKMTSNIDATIKPIERGMIQEQKIRDRTKNSLESFSDEVLARERDWAKGAGRPPRIPGGTGTPGGPGAGEFSLRKGEVIPVHIHSVREGIGLSFTPGKMQDVITGAKAGIAPYDIEELRMLQKQAAGITKTMSATYENLYRASGLRGGGAFGYKGGFEGPEFKEEQIKAIMSQMAPKPGEADVKYKAEAAALLGTALHTIIAQQKKEEAVETGTFDYDIERFVSYFDEFAGDITGHVDLIKQRMDASGNLIDDTIIDIKTISDKMARRLAQSGITEFKDVARLQKEGIISQADRSKLEETASQINLYMKAVAEANGVAAESLKGEMWFYNREDIEQMVPVQFTFDPKRLERDLAAVAEARKRVLEDPSRKFAQATHMADLQRAEQQRKMKQQAGKYSDLSDVELQKLYGGAKEYMADIERSPWLGEVLYSKGKRRLPEMDPSFKTSAKYRKFEEYTIPKAPLRGKEVAAAFENLKALHEEAVNYQMEVSKIGFGTIDFQTFDKRIQDLLSDVKEQGPQGSKFMDLVTQLRKTEEISGAELAKAWKYYRIAVGDFFLNQAEEASKLEEEMSSAGEIGEARKAYRAMQDAVNRMKDTIKKGLGKPTDIYTASRRYISPDIAQALDLYLTPQQLLEKSKEPLGDAPKLEALFKKSVVGDIMKGGRLTPPIEKARAVFAGLSEMDATMVDVLTNADKFERMGENVQDAWKFDEIVDNISKIRAALESFIKFKFQEGEDVVERKNLENTLKLLKSLEAAYTTFNTQKIMSAKTGVKMDWGETGIAKVPTWLDPSIQEAMHKRNIQMVREYYKRTEEEGGPRKGERYIYPMKIIGETGDVIKNVAVDFKKYGDAINFAGENVGVFREKSRDLMEFMQGSNRTFKAAIMRAVRWGAASKIVYGGWQNLMNSIGMLADIEMGMAQLRMVMSPLETDFSMMSKSAIGFAKQYGVAMTDVLQGMKIFAQQGLRQEEVIDRTKTATLAANVTTLSAKEATEALTAAMKVFRQEGESSMRFMDAWSEVEAKHAITAGNMANALKKSASAGKNAGFTFDELNGIIAAIGSVTRQSGKEVGTSMRFIFRRLTSEKAPTELAKIGIPTLTDTGELRRGYDILTDLAGAWKDLTSAQRMNIAQAIGGTRQYNSLLVLMDNWDEALIAIEDSVNSKGSAERRNLEMMKTYTKQLQQLKEVQELKQLI